MIHQFEIIVEVIDDDSITSYDATWQTSVIDSGWTGGAFFQVQENMLEPPSTVCYVTFLVLMQGGKYPAFHKYHMTSPHVPLVVPQLEKTVS